ASTLALPQVSLAHTDGLGETRGATAAEKLAVVARGAIVIVGEPEWEEAARAAGAARVDVLARSNLALAVAAAEAFLGRPVDAHAAAELRIPGRLERRGEAPLEIWDGAHNLAGVGYLLPRLPSRRFTVVASILRDKDAAAMLAALAAIGDTLVATSSTSERALPAAALAALARERFAHVETVADPAAAVALARRLAGAGGAVLVTGSLYLLADLSAD